jgi:hypothetical protein
MDELLKALDSLEIQEFEDLFDDLERGIQKATEHFIKWMIPWCHLPLSICRLAWRKFKSIFCSKFSSHCFRIALDK